jgi:hypothetical protein
MMTAANRSARAACNLQAAKNKGATRKSIFAGGRKTRRSRKGKRSTRRH